MFGSPSHPDVDAKYAHAIWCIENKNIPAKLHMINMIQIKDYWNIVRLIDCFVFVTCKPVVHEMTGSIFDY